MMPLRPFMPILVLLTAGCAVNVDKAADFAGNHNGRPSYRFVYEIETRTFASLKERNLARQARAYCEDFKLLSRKRLPNRVGTPYSYRVNGATIRQTPIYERTEVHILC